MADETKPNNTLEQNTKLLAGLGYLGILFIVPLIVAGQDQFKKDAGFLKYHANQGLVLFIAEIVFGIIVTVVNGMLFATLSPLVMLAGLLWMAVWVIGLIFLILGFMNAMNGVKKPLPVIGGITIIK